MTNYKNHTILSLVSKYNQEAPAIKHYDAHIQAQAVHLLQKRGLVIS